MCAQIFYNYSQDTHPVIQRILALLLATGNQMPTIILGLVSA